MWDISKASEVILYGCTHVNEENGEEGGEDEGVDTVEVDEDLEAEGVVAVGCCGTGDISLRRIGSSTDDGSTSYRG